jgi:hypothetical protein
MILERRIPTIHFKQPTPLCQSDCLVKGSPGKQGKEANHFLSWTFLEFVPVWAAMSFLRSPTVSFGEHFTRTIISHQLTNNVGQIRGEGNGEGGETETRPTFPSESVVCNDFDHGAAHHHRSDWLRA